MTAGSPDPDTLHRGELDVLFTDLIEAGYRAASGDRHNWTGPLPASLRRLTAATAMRIEIRDGWPYVHPYLYVEGLGARKHVSGTDNTCLWFEDDDNYKQWLRLDGIEQRIDAWVADQEAGASAPVLDAHLYFQRRVAGLLTFDLDDLVRHGRVVPRAGASGELRVKRTGQRYALGEHGSITAAWFWQTGVVAAPSRADAFRQLLTRDQKRLFDRMSRSVTRSHPAVVLLLWDDGDQTNALGLLLERSSPGYYLSGSIEVARVDAPVMRLRAGPDADRLRECRVLILGVGAIGSEIAMLLARSGIGAMALVDNDTLRPANLTRHAASARFVGLPKAKAVADTIAENRLPTVVDALNTIVWEPSLLKLAVERADLVIDATGNSAYSDMASRICAASGRPLVAAALHRSGQILRVRIQVSPSAEPIWGRSSATGFPDVPADPAPPASQTWEVGCGAPVNNAPPTSVVMAGARAAGAAIDVLTGRLARDADLIEVYQGIEAEPFSTPGSFVIEASS